MQKPTLTNIRIRSVEDAHVILYATHRGFLNVITSRLDADERQALRPGDVYVWIEGNHQADITGLGIMRWTDGRKWSQSRTRDEFLYYEEEDPNGGAPPRPQRMVKQTYSAMVAPTALRGPYRICLHTYYTDNSIRLLGTIDAIPELRDLQVPPGLFTRVKRTARKSRDGPLHSETQNTSPPHSHHIVHDTKAASQSTGFIAPTFAPSRSPSSRSPPPESKERHGTSISSGTASHDPYDTTSHVAPHQGFSYLDPVTPDNRHGNIPRSLLAGHPVPVHRPTLHTHLSLSPYTFSECVIVSPNAPGADHSASPFISGAFGERAVSMDSIAVRDLPRMTSSGGATSSGWQAARESPADVVLQLAPFEQLRKDRSFPSRSPIDDGHLKLLSNVASCV